MAITPQTVRMTAVGMRRHTANGSREGKTHRVKFRRGTRKGRERNQQTDKNVVSLGAGDAVTTGKKRRTSPKDLKCQRREV